MIHFDDYHRTIVGCHGTRLPVALDLVNRRKPYESPENEGDWLGRGVYFWEYAPRQTEWRANRVQKLKKWDEPVATLGSMIRLGNCPDLLDPLNMKEVKIYHGDYCKVRRDFGEPIPPEVGSTSNLTSRFACGIPLVSWGPGCTRLLPR